jgi:uncharacterized protein YqjF (DUF2071 family)
MTRPVMHQQWNRLTFVHWRYPPAAVQALLPPDLTVETFEGTAWIGLVPFLMEDVRPAVGPAVPWLSRFPETNVRTYVRDERGRPGIWFFSLDAARLPAVVAGRVTYGLPYCWSGMAVRAAADHAVYRSRRRWPAPAGAHLSAHVRVGPTVAADDLVDFLTARFRLFTVIGGRLASAAAEHPPWPLHRAELLHLDQDLVQAAGLPAPTGDPLVHASPGVSARIGAWSRVPGRVDRDRRWP